MFCSLPLFPSFPQAPDQRHDALRYFKQPYNAHRALQPEVELGVCWSCGHAKQRGQENGS